MNEIKTSELMVPFTVEQGRTWVAYDQFDTYEKAEAEARSKAWESGKPQFIMKAIARIDAPTEINTVPVVKL